MTDAAAPPQQITQQQADQTVFDFGGLIVVTLIGSELLRLVLHHGRIRAATAERVPCGVGLVAGSSAACPDKRPGDGPAVREQLTEIVEDDHAVAQQAPSLLGMGRDDPGGVAVRTIRRRARRPV